MIYVMIIDPYSGDERLYGLMNWIEQTSYLNSGCYTAKENELKLLIANLSYDFL